MALHSTGKPAHFPNYNNSLCNRGCIGPKCLNLQYEAWTLKTAANLLPKLKPLIHINNITDMWLPEIHSFIKNITACLTVLRSCFNTLFTVWQYGEKVFCFWLISFVECGLGPFKMRKQQHAAGFFLGVMLWKDTIIVNIQELYTGIFLWICDRKDKQSKKPEALCFLKRTNKFTM